MYTNRKKSIHKKVDSLVSPFKKVTRDASLFMAEAPSALGAFLNRFLQLNLYDLSADSKWNKLQQSGLMICYKSYQNICTINPYLKIVDKKGRLQNCLSCIYKKSSRFVKKENHPSRNGQRRSERG